MRFFIATGPDGVVEVLACHSLQGPMTRSEGLTLRGALMPVNEITGNRPFSPDVTLYTDACQTLPTASFEEIDLVEFRRLKHYFESSFALHWHQISQAVFPDIWLALEEYNRKPQPENEAA